MALIAIDGAPVLHTGSVFGGSVSGTLNANISWLTIDGTSIGTQDSIMNIPSHYYAPLLTHSHQFNPNSFNQAFVTVESKNILVVGDSYSGDATEITGPGANSFVSIS